MPSVDTAITPRFDLPLPTARQLKSSVGPRFDRANELPVRAVIQWEFAAAQTAEPTCHLGEHREIEAAIVFGR